MTRNLVSLVAALGLLALPANAVLAQDMNGPMPVMEVSISPAGGSGAMGKAWIVPTMDPSRMMVTVMLTGLEAMSSHSNHIHSGSCEATGGIVHPLSELTADDSGTAVASSIVNVGMDTMGMASYYLYFHQGLLGTGPAAGQGIACGNITSSGMMMLVPAMPMMNMMQNVGQDMMMMDAQQQVMQLMMTQNPQMQNMMNDMQTMQPMPEMAPTR